MVGMGESSNILVPLLRLILYLNYVKIMGAVSAFMSLFFNCP